MRQKGSRKVAKTQSVVKVAAEGDILEITTLSAWQLFYPGMLTFFSSLRLGDFA